ncbi:hypothetical protein B8V81_2709 [Paenibacillus pasadenensis]|uniref:Uncharacterized protein n=1 Tax=Paenibacillus pasadenensis TaxID=217090 RepID=A0A2N5N1R5_9BACL|nr:hypothetical protein B8V81_2709 [Paenibacillus pasadenensis]
MGCCGCSLRRFLHEKVAGQSRTRAAHPLTGKRLSAITSSRINHSGGKR